MWRGEERRGEERRGEERRGEEDKGTIQSVCLLPPWDYRQLFNLTSYRDKAHTNAPRSGFHF